MHDLDGLSLTESMFAHQLRRESCGGPHPGCMSS
jgi:hypothetical protein